jgi:hypothetical protein
MRTEGRLRAAGVAAAHQAYSLTMDRHASAALPEALRYVTYVTCKAGASND